MKGQFTWKTLLTGALCAAVVFSAASSLAISNDKDLLIRAKQVFGPLPTRMPAGQSPITAEKIALGRILFYETRLSIDGTVSCAKCHPISLYGADGLPKAVGNQCRPNPRNSPTIFNAAAQVSAHWIGNRKTVEDQAKQALVGPPSFGMPSYEAAEKKLKEIKGYEPLFKKAFPGDKDPLTVDNFAAAIGAFERTLVTPAPFDGFLTGKKGAYNEARKKGLETFMDRGCGACHGSPYVGGQMYQKFGLLEPYWKYTKSEPVDEGRHAITKEEKDNFVFKVPPLRNVERTPPYFHDGSVDKLEDAVSIMGRVQVGKSLTDDEIAAIVTFLKSLTGKIPDYALRVPLLPSMEPGPMGDTKDRSPAPEGRTDRP
jgi:cytochrome c peroxidase